MRHRRLLGVGLAQARRRGDYRLLGGDAPLLLGLQLGGDLRELRLLRLGLGLRRLGLFRRGPYRAHEPEHQRDDGEHHHGATESQGTEATERTCLNLGSPETLRRSGTSTSGLNGPSSTELNSTSGKRTFGGSWSRKTIVCAMSSALRASIGKRTSSSIGVATGPVVTTCTLIPSRSTSFASENGTTFSPAFDAPYGLRRDAVRVPMTTRGTRTVLLRHDRQRCGRHDERGPQVRADDVVERVDGFLPHERALVDASRVHEQVDASGCADHAREPVRVGAVGRDVARADRRRPRLATALRTRRQHDVVSGGGEQSTRRQADTAAATGDDRYPRALIHREEPTLYELAGIAVAADGPVRVGHARSSRRPELVQRRAA